MTPEAPEDALRRVPIHRIQISPLDVEPRRLDAKLVANTILPPPLVRPWGVLDDRFELIAGSTFFELQQERGQTEIDVKVRQLSDVEAVLASLQYVEGLGVDPVERARAILRAAEASVPIPTDLDGERKSQRLFRDDVTFAKALGRSQQHIAHMRALLSLGETILARVKDGQISTRAATKLAYRHKSPHNRELIARAMVGLRPAGQLRILEAIDAVPIVLTYPEEEFLAHVRQAAQASEPKKNP